MIASKSNELLFIETFVMKSSAASNAVVTSHLGRLGITPVANRAIMRWASELLCGCRYILDNSSSMVWEFIFELCGEEAVQMIKSVAFTREWALINSIIVLFFYLSPRLCPLGPWANRFFFVVVPFFQAYPALKSIIFGFAVDTFFIVRFRFFPLLEIHA